MSALCRSRRELSNEYLLANIGFDTAEITRLSKLGGKFNSLFIFASYKAAREELKIGLRKPVLGQIGSKSAFLSMYVKESPK